MDIDLYNSELCLTHNAPIRLLSARGVRIHCTAGVVWLTVAGEAGDILLRPGESHLVSGHGLALLEAIGSGQVRFEKAAQPLPAFLRAQVQRLLGRVPVWPLPARRSPLPLPVAARQVSA
ncbi:MAG: hypothetical protein AW09_001514 [Candidatus Accumulibacter phosphatis]|uniref:DUF2917 domain-containing protein n=1 Tax=Candidatus Accumulibacter phosphatis TaxID=327160 RepID=A0A080M7Z1_9PROT|nr:DUF2917 domain-containing protein [Accumulibacter sp.]KFB73254.1 MAG: hypothetical protein AW09_001514 [Candidatus Accumulibacter phosphatis]MBL8409312.1 DUF2917 domain-containing protein [Accumulibacter sp.]HRF12604.1 DUF2917 domain-containing protein [Candidatus Accumulibacter phosphatis]